jgi:hypothetical protein
MYMQLSNYFERAVPKEEDPTLSSPIIYRAIQFETKLSPESIKEIARDVYPGIENLITIIGVTPKRITRFRVSVTDASTFAFANLIYQWMNWENNDSKQNKW